MQQPGVRDGRIDQHQVAHAGQHPPLHRQLEDHAIVDLGAAQPDAHDFVEHGGKIRPDRPRQRGGGFDFNAAAQCLDLFDDLFLFGVLFDPLAEPLHPTGLEAGVFGGLFERFV